MNNAKFLWKLNTFGASNDISRATDTIFSHELITPHFPLGDGASSNQAQHSDLTAGSVNVAVRLVEVGQQERYFRIGFGAEESRVLFVRLRDRD